MQQPLRVLTSRRLLSGRRAQTIATLMLALALVSGCSVLFPERAAARRREERRLEHCKRTLPILRAEPSEPYRVIRIVEAYSEEDLAWYACVEKADAVISTFTEDYVTTTRMAGNANFIGGRSRTSSEAKFVGRAIRYGFGASQIQEDEND